MSFEAAARSAQRQEFLIADRACRLKERVQQGGGMPFRENEMVVIRVLRVVKVVAQVAGQEHRH